MLAGPARQDVVVSERRFQYEAEVRRNPMNYDAWFDYVRLEESAGDPDKVNHCPFNSLPFLRDYQWTAHVCDQSAQAAP